MEISEDLKRRTVVLVPYPFQGHITPMLQLGSILHSMGFSIVVAHTECNSPNPSNHPEFTFLPLPDKLAPQDTAFSNILNAVTIINTNCKAPFQDYMVSMQGEVACVVYDTIMTFVDPVANDLKIPTIVLRTTMAAYIHSHIEMFRLLDEKLIPLPESQVHEAVPEVHPLRYKDLPLSPTIEIPQIIIDFTKSYTDIRSSCAVIWNTVNVLDNGALHQLHQQVQVPFFPIGPFHKIAPITSSLMEEDNSCLSWLDKQAPNSVIYVSLGSLATIEEKELHEMAWGLGKSEQPFLWVVRPSLLNGMEAIGHLPEGFEDMTRERGKVVKWAPQKKVLAHSAVGGFLSHCGWNSTLESLCEGVPLICMPCFADQKVNSRYLSYVWRVGLELESVMEASIARAVRTLMVGEEGNEIRQRAIDMKKELENSLNLGGSSHDSLNCLAEFINSLPERK